MKLYITVILTFLFFIPASIAQPKIKLDTFTLSVPKPADITNDGFTSRLFIADQNGRIFVYDSIGVKLDTFLDIRTKVQYTNGGEQGLLGIAFHPDYKNNGYFYVYYTKKNTTDNAVFRYKVSSNPNRALVDSEVLVINLIHPLFPNHNGGCLKFGNDGYLYIGVGDGGGGGDPFNNAQNKNSFLGKILRLDVNNFSIPYSVPISNPFVGQANVKAEIWAYGLRNPWRFSFDKLTHDLWIGDVGQGAREEVDFQASNSTGGVNYGWRCYEGNSSYNTSGCGNTSNYTFPIFEYDHSSNGGVAITGGFVYRGNNYPDFYGYYLCTDYTSNNFWAIKKEGSTFTSYTLGKPQTGLYSSSFGEDIFGEMYLCNSVSGVIYKIRELCSPFQLSLVNKTNPSCPNITNGSIEFTSISPNGNVNYNWSNGGTGNTISTLAAGKYILTATDGIGCVRKDSVTLYNTDTLDTPIVTLSNDTLSTISGYSYQWKLNDSVINGATASFYKAPIAGLYRVEITDSNGCKAISDTVRFIVTAIKNINSTIESFSVFPNPVNDKLRIEIQFVTSKKSVLKIINTIGQEIYAEQLAGKDIIQTISLQNLEKGIYEITIITDDGQISTKTFVKQ